MVRAGRVTGLGVSVQWGIGTAAATASPGNDPGDRPALLL